MHVRVLLHMAIITPSTLNPSPPLQVPAYVLHAIGQCARLSSLDLTHQHSVTLEGLQALSSLTGLRELALGPCQAVCDEGAALLSQRHCALTRLALHHGKPPGQLPPWGPTFSSKPFTAGSQPSAALSLARDLLEQRLHMPRRIGNNGPVVLRRNFNTKSWWPLLEEQEVVTEGNCGMLRECG